MELLSTDVESHAGRRTGEYPTRFLGMDGWVDVAEVVDQWYQDAPDREFPVSDCLRARAHDGKHRLLRHGREAGQWSLVTRD